MIQKAWTTARSPRAREFGLLLASTGLLQASRFAFSMLAATQLPPPDFAIWALVLAAVTYAPSMLAGISNGMARDLPYLVGAGRHAEADRIEFSVRVTALVACTAVSLAGIGVALAVGDALPFATSVVLGLAVLFHVDQFAYRSRLAFPAAGVQQAVFAVGLIVAGGWLLSLNRPSVTEVVSAYGAGLLASVAVLYRIHRRRVDWMVLRRLARIGFPIMLAGLAHALLTTADRWIAAIYLSDHDAGLYSLASVVAASVAIASTIISQQTYPRMAMAFGSGANRAELREMASRQSAVAVWAVAVLSGVIVLGAGVVLPRLLPAYADSLLAIVIVCVGLVAMSTSVGLGNYLNVVGAHWVYLSVQLLAILLGIPCMVIGALLHGIYGIAVGLAAALTAYSCLLLVATWLRDRRYVEGSPPRSRIHSG